MADFDDLFEPNAIESRAGLCDFLDRQAVRIARDVVGDYTRARLPGGDTAPLADPALRAGMEKATWEALPAVLSLLGDQIESDLASLAYDRLVQLQGLIAVAAEVFDRHEAPPQIGPQAWEAARAGLVRHLSDLAARPAVRREAAIETFAGSLLAMMPFDLALGPDDYPMLCGLLASKLAGARGEFAREANAPALAKALSSRHGAQSAA